MILHSQEEFNAYSSVFQRGELGQDIEACVERRTGEKVTSLWALLQNGVV